jgi:hypothetical protein
LKHCGLEDLIEHPGEEDQEGNTPGNFELGRLVNLVL